jgi:hypothetical protein
MINIASMIMVTTVTYVTLSTQDDHMGAEFWEDYRMRVRAKEKSYPVEAESSSGPKYGRKGRLSNSRMFRWVRRPAVRSLGIPLTGGFLALAGTFWLLCILDYSLPWHAVFPLAVVLAGGAFISAPRSYGAKSEKEEHNHDRCDH